MTGGRAGLALWLVALLVVAGCARSTGVPGAEGAVRSPHLVESAALGDEVEAEAEDYDPWQPFNQRMFWFNHDVLDRFLIKPAAQGWEKTVPEPARRSISRAFANLDMPRRFVNNLLQARPIGAGRELARFTINSTVGIVGLLDVAARLHIEASEADAGETLALYGIGAGPYLVLPTMPPGTVRDAIGLGIDGLLDPLGYVLPFIANRAKSIVSAINERSLKLKLFADVEDSALDLYSAARNGYLQHRRRAVLLAIEKRHQEWMWMDLVGGPAEPERTATVTTAALVPDPS